MDAQHRVAADIRRIGGHSPRSGDQDIADGADARALQRDVAARQARLPVGGHGRAGDVQPAAGVQVHVAARVDAAVGSTQGLRLHRDAAVCRQLLADELEAGRRDLQRATGAMSWPAPPPSLPTAPAWTLRSPGV